MIKRFINWFDLVVRWSISVWDTLGTWLWTYKGYRIMIDNNSGFFIGMMLTAVFLIICSSFLGINHTREDVLVKRNLAYYNTTTGKFTLKDYSDASDCN